MAAFEQTETATERLLSVEEAAQHLGVSVGTVRNYVSDGKLKASRLAGKRMLRFTMKDLSALLEPAGPSDV